MQSSQGAYNEAVDVHGVTAPTHRGGKGLILEYLLQSRLLECLECIFEGYGHIEDGDGSRRFMLHDYVGSQDREITPGTF